MSKLMLIDANHPEETRVAVVSNGQIEDFDFEARNKRQLRGNIYLAKVTRVEPSLQAAFVDYGGNRHGFLAFSEIHPDYYQIPKEDREALLAEADEQDDDEDEAEASEAGESEEEAEDEDERKANRRNAFFQRKYKIQEVIRRRQVMLVQVVKEERGNKGAALTTYLSLAGRYCVLMPNTSRGGGISRKITNANDRRRLKAITSEFEVPKGAGLIVRTAGAKRTKNEVRRDFEYLTKLWQQIVGKTMESMAPALIHEEGHLVLRAVRDLYDKDVERIVVEGEEAYQEAKTFVKMLMPAHARKVVLHEDAPPLFVQTGVESQLDGIFSPTVQLPSGGYIVINQTEALVAIDVNSGKATRERNVEATALKTNLEAAAEACRQMRLRDLAGLIVIDFIDMEDGKNNRSVERKMKDCLKIDRARVQTGRISQFGLFEISRQRRRAGVLELSSEPCDHCGGTGRMRSVESAALQLLRAIEARAADDRVESVHVEAAPEVALYLLNEKRTSIADIERSCHVAVRIEANDEFKTGEFAIEGRADGQAIAYQPMKPVDLIKLKPLPPPGPDEIEEEEEEEIADSDESEEGEGEDDHDHHHHHDEEEDESEAREDDEDEEDHGGRSRRRGRRGGRRRRGGREAPAGLEVVEPSDDMAHAQPRDRDEGGRGGRGRGRRRRGGRDRNRTPDIAADGGEMLDAIASAPFLVAAQAAETAPEAVPAEAPAVEMASVPVFEAPAESESQADENLTETGQEAAPPRREDEKPARTREVEHENAASSVEAAAIETPPEPDSVEPKSSETRRHSIHGAPEDQPAEPAAQPRKVGWWSRRKTG
ncbi:MAG TPA: Rne/Rng family ribonuclease [Hyphomonadaceae bacterium]|nr:Rne/Rng family ribonuclease [Hyphomonadaceae bacterium]